MVGRSQHVQLGILKMWQEGQGVCGQQSEGQASEWKWNQANRCVELGPVGDSHMERDTLCGTV